LSFGGGGTDVSPFCDEIGGAVLNATINRYAYCTLRSSDRIKIRSIDFDQTVAYDMDEDFVYGGQMDLAVGVLDHFRTRGLLGSGVEVCLHNDAPPGSGLGSSSAIAVAMTAALSTHFRLDLDTYEVARLAYQIERVEVGQCGGRQDQYAAAFGGFNFMEFSKMDAVVHPLRIKRNTINEMEYRLVSAYVGGSRFSSRIIERQARNYADGDTDSITAMKTLRDLSYEMRDALLTNRLDDFSRLLDASWEAKKAMASGISNSSIDEIYSRAKASGAAGGKVTGAGGGGFMFFMCDPGERFAVQGVLRDMGCQLVDFSFSKDGVVTWTAT